MLIGFQGEHGAYSEAASINYNSGIIPIPCKKFGDVIRGVEQKNFDAGLLPVENSIEGAVNEVNDLLINTELVVIGEVIQPINHCLLTLKETDYREIKRVYSHPLALAQCQGFIQRNQLESFLYYDTAGAAKMLSEERPSASAVIAGDLCAKLYDLDIIKENISDKPKNFTRFLILSTSKNEEKGNKCSIVFATTHKAGSLFSILELYKNADINLTRIESKPFKKEPGNYLFFVDFMGSLENEKVKNILLEVEKKSIFYKFLGCYRGKSNPVD